MLLWVGLGNPGDKYNNNRHNIGFMAVDGIVRRHNFSPYKSHFQGLVSDGRLGLFKILILKPQTFMNLSGQSVSEAAHFYKIPPKDIFVFHDELDIAAAKIKFKTGGGHAGNNGIRNIIQHMGADFNRIRIGISHPGDKSHVSNHVLGDFSKSDLVWREALLDAIAYAAPALTDGSGETTGAKFLNEIGRRLKPNEK